LATFQLSSSLIGCITAIVNVALLIKWSIRELILSIGQSEKIAFEKQAIQKETIGMFFIAPSLVDRFQGIQIYVSISSCL